MGISDRLLGRCARLPGFLSLWTKFPVGTITTRVRFGAFSRPHYAYGIYSAAELAKRLGVQRISVIEWVWLAETACWRSANAFQNRLSSTF